MSDPKSKVEIKGFTARHYDFLMNVGSFGAYSPFIKKAIKLMKIKPDDKIIDLGSGTGRNACLMGKYISSKGKIVGVDISSEMIGQFEEKCKLADNINVFKQKIDEPLKYNSEFDKVFISFVLHGFPQKKRMAIVNNALKALKDKGKFFILDYNEFSLEELSFLKRNLFKFIECPYAFDFIKRDWKKILSENGFSNFKEYFFFGNFIRLLEAERTSR